jgi:plasmid stabilization system protein ParE
MKKTFEILWASVAEKDLTGIIEYIATEDPRSAVPVLNRIKGGTAKLDENPKRGHIVPELLKQGISRYREIVIPPWRMIYRVDESIVYVISVIDGRRNVEDILLERLIK